MVVEDHRRRHLRERSTSVGQRFVEPAQLDQSISHLIASEVESRDGRKLGRDRVVTFDESSDTLKWAWPA